MRFKVTHRDHGLRDEGITEMCCDTMSKVIDNEVVTSNSGFADSFSEDYKPFNIFKYDDRHNPVEFYPLEFCPFCGDKISIEFIDGRLTSH